MLLEWPNEMGRRETYYLQASNCDSMAQQNKKMRPVLLKRNSLDSVDFMRQPHHRRSKSQQVRFKDDGTNKKPIGVTEMDTKPAKDTTLMIGKAQISRHHNLPNYSLSFPRAQKGHRNIAIQTSPSLRKHFPVFKKKKLTTSKSLMEMPTEPECSVQVNGNLSEQDMSLDLSYLRITKHLEDGSRTAKTSNPLFQRECKAQSNGPIHSDSDTSAILEKATVYTQVPEYIHLTSSQDNSASVYASDMAMDLNDSVRSPTTMRQSNENYTLPSKSGKSPSCLNNTRNCNEINPHYDSCEAKSVLELPVSTKDTSTNENTPLSPLSNQSSSHCFLREHQQLTEPETDSDCMVLTNDNHGITSLTSSNESKSIPSCHTEMDKTSTRSYVPEYSNYLEDFHIKSHLPGNEIKPETNKEIRDINQIHLAHGELCALQGRLQSIEESLHSNQEKIKVLLNVIQDLEKARALSEGRNFYRTGQDLNNCSTCQNTACIIYSVEYDFRQQEGRFHQVLKTLDQVEQTPATAPAPKLPPDHPIPEKQELRRKTKKVKKKCFWWM
ncbi:protein INSYN2B isoform X1 [Malaclemys terrapin pileata]|uniref:protein INSYN2B isoform X1 n=2 Tax=Malaclemys terrapin pileata TaxID=2991368 RepID=UPI0023A897CA|nr:protein INSYN2B isoform X1 [Malaclemys terrapin pileata]